MRYIKDQKSKLPNHLDERINNWMNLIYIIAVFYLIQVIHSKWIILKNDGSEWYVIGDINVLSILVSLLIIITIEIIAQYIIRMISISFLPTAKKELDVAEKNDMGVFSEVSLKRQRPIIRNISRFSIYFGLVRNMSDFKKNIIDLYKENTILILNKGYIIIIMALIVVYIETGYVIPLICIASILGVFIIICNFYYYLLEDYENFENKISEALEDEHSRNCKH